MIEFILRALVVNVSAWKFCTLTEIRPGGVALLSGGVRSRDNSAVRVNGAGLSRKRRTNRYHGGYQRKPYLAELGGDLRRGYVTQVEFKVHSMSYLIAMMLV
jgi:hypothetical protein